MTRTPSVDRRSVLTALGTGAVALTAGCATLDPRSGGYDHVVLDPPEQYDRLRQARDDGALAHPIYGDELPEVTVPDVLRERAVSTTDFEGEAHTLYTFIFVRCHGACPALVSSLRTVQADSIDEGYADDVALLPVTFDPEHDNRDVLVDYGEDMGVEYDADNWYFLRPETEEDAHHVVAEEFGCYFERNPDYEGSDHDHSDDDHDGGGDDHDHSDDDHGDDDHGDDDHGGNGNGSGNGNGHDVMAFQHESMILVANAGGYVERTYTGSRLPSPGDLVDDVRAIAEGW